VELQHQFTVPAPIEETWRAFNDLERVAPCFPGATLTSVEGDQFSGSVKIKLGPISMQYAGTGTFLERDEDSYTARFEAKGKDKRGNGTAAATVTARLVPDGDSTDVQVQTDLAITGKPAQFGRGVMQDVSDKLLGQFTDCLEQKVGASSAAAAEGRAAESAPSRADQPSEATVSADTDPGPTTPASSDGGRPPQQDDALDLGATVLPVLVKSYWRQALAVLVVLLVLRRLMRR
jgi:uncharacterized protein